MDFKTYKGEIGRLDFLKTLFACCLVNWILSVIITIASSAISPIFIALYVLSLYVVVLIMFCYKKRLQSIFRNEIISWIIAIYMALFNIGYSLYSVAACVYMNLLEANKISELPNFIQDDNILMYICYAGVAATIILLICLFVPGKKQ